MAAKAVEQLPAGPTWSFEPKYDGFRALASPPKIVHPNPILLGRRNVVLDRAVITQP
jgi:hypothetical protein